MSTNATRAGRCIGIDHGSKRIGVAVSDPSRVLASALPHLPAETALEDVVRLAEDMDATEIVIGLPLNMDGSWSQSAHAARDFATALRKATDIRVSTWDERLSTVEAGRRLSDSGVKAKRQKNKIDSAAAAVVLQSFLDGARVSY